jgi:hypothetical protein
MIKDTFKNSVAPVNVTQKGGGDRVIGNVQIVALEVAVSKLLRWALRMAPRGILDLAFIHTVSLGFMGGFAGPFNRSQPIDGNVKATDALGDGLKMVPAVFAAQYVASVASQGLNMGFKQISVKDLLITAASKAVTRPMWNLIYKSLPQKMADGIDAHDYMMERQRNASRLRSKGN